MPGRASDRLVESSGRQGAAPVTRNDPVTMLPGVGRVKAACYEKMGVRTLGDLLEHYPRAYEDRGSVCLLANARADGKSAVVLTIATQPRCVQLRSHKSFLKFRAYDESASCEIVYFNQSYLRDAFEVGAEYRFWGKVERKNGGRALSMSAPAAERLQAGVALPDLHPVWRMTDGLSQKQLAKDIAAALELLAADGADWLPGSLCRRRSLCTLAYAQRNIHLPESVEALGAARRRLVYDEFFATALGTQITRIRTRTLGAPVCSKGDLSALTAQLPYQLTGAQARVIGEIRQDMAGEVPMRRMLVGDVGCGKTVCAAAAMLIAVQSGRQAVLMAPTEILARQHYAELSGLFEKLGIRCGLLVGASTAKEKREIKAALASNDPAQRLQVVVGTHALLTQDVTFVAPGLVVTDEQHRFGAVQRAVLADKNTHAHLLVMSATPIPRSLALALYGDLALSRIDEMPAGRQRVDTFVVDDGYRERLNGFIRQQVEAGGQVYVVCPAVEEQEAEEPEELALSAILNADEREEKPPLKAAVTYAESLQHTFPAYTVAFLHGKQKSREKDEIMRRFAAGEIQILVSTTVIEVGVNVPNACLMIVENAERFGLSQLHQLRGRVGRGTRRSYCVLVAGTARERLSAVTRARLEVMRTTYDGYAIAEQDLNQRGPGDLLRSLQRQDGGGLRQSGEVQFRLANAQEDATILHDAAEDAAWLIEQDPELAQHPLVRERVEDLYRTEDGLIS